jgi:molecular chaperone GrpE
MNSVDFSANATNEIRAAILRRFESWLDQALEEEQPPSDLDRDLLSAFETGSPLPPLEGCSDLYALWSAVTALTQEVKLEGRSFKQLNETLTHLPETIARAVRQETSMAPIYAEGQEEERWEQDPPACATGARSLPENQHLDLLLDLRDRLDRGLSSITAANNPLAESLRPSGWRRWFPRSRDGYRHAQELLSAVEKGYLLTLDRLEQALRDLRLDPIVCRGEQFDSRRMTAIELEWTDAVPEGTVVEVFRAGYEWEGEVYRTAQVKVARKKQGGAGEQRQQDQGA